MENTKNRRPRAKSYPSDSTKTLSSGGIDLYKVVGDFVRVKYADSAFKILLDSTNEYDAEINKLIRLKDGDSFKTVEVVNSSGGTLTYQLEIGYGEITSDSVAISGNVSVVNAPGQSIKIENLTGTSLNTKIVDNTALACGQVSVDNVADQIVASNAGRKGLLVQNHSLTTDLYIGPANTVTTSNGFLVRAGGGAYLPYSGALWGITSSATAITVSYAEVEP